ncbi:MAG: ATP/GTP-binding protein [Fervidicoccaceae archaeon]|jgi:GTPase SAR1 family protein|nr:ATP/GTP-binding protein [Fervidicoccaceae archaeon]
MGPKFFIIAGTAGSGKSTLTKLFGDWLESNDIPVVRVNLDPAAEDLPYTPNVDVRDYVDVYQVMRKYKLGPNGALLVSMDILVNHSEEISKEIYRNTTPRDYVLIDTPGQLEIFAFRRGSQELIKNLVLDNKATIGFLMDSSLISSSLNVISLLLLANSVYVRLRLPMITIISKYDLLNDEMKRIIDAMTEDPELINEIIYKEDVPESGIEDLIEVAISRNYGLIPVSVYDDSTFEALFSALQNSMSSIDDIETSI